MSGGFPLFGELCNGTDQGSDTSNSRGTAVACGASNVKGTYVQLIASSAVDASWMMVCITPSISAVHNSWNLVFDIAVGAAASEKIIAADLLISNHHAVLSHITYLIPCCIPAGTRISARGQGENATPDTLYVSVILFEGGFGQSEGAAGVDSIGFVSATTLGTALDAGTTVNTKGAYVELVASTPRDYVGFYVGIGNPGASPPIGDNARFLMDIAIGAGGSEKIIIPNLPSMRERLAAILEAVGPIYVPVPAGTRISARIQCSSNTVNLKEINIVMHGIYH